VACARSRRAHWMRIGTALAFTSERQQHLLTLKGLLERLHVRSDGRLSLADAGEQSRERIDVAADCLGARRPLYAPGISPKCSSKSLLMPLVLSLAHWCDCMK
jgi:hypothetical protein